MAFLRLKELRDMKNLNQADIAAHLQIARTTYARYETGEREMTYDALISLAELFAVSIDYLLGRQEVIPSFLNEDERAVIAQYKVLDERAKNAVKNCLAFEHSQTPKSESDKKAI